MLDPGPNIAFYLARAHPREGATFLTFMLLTLDRRYEREAARFPM